MKSIWHFIGTSTSRVFGIRHAWIGISASILISNITLGSRVTGPSPDFPGKHVIGRVSIGQTVILTAWCTVIINNDIFSFFTSIPKCLWYRGGNWGHKNWALLKVIPLPQVQVINISRPTMKHPLAFICSGDFSGENLPCWDSHCFLRRARDPIVSLHWLGLSTASVPTKPFPIPTKARLHPIQEWVRSLMERIFPYLSFQESFYLPLSRA